MINCCEDIENLRLDLPFCLIRGFNIDPLILKSHEFIYQFGYVAKRVDTSVEGAPLFQTPIGTRNNELSIAQGSLYCSSGER